MRNSFGKALLAQLVLFIILLSSCASYNKKEAMEVKEAVETKEAIEMKEAIDQVITQSQTHIVEGDFQKAIDSYKASHEKYPDNEVLLDNYIMAIEEMKRTADKALSKEDYSLAEKIYSVLLKNYSYFKKLDKPLSFSKGSLSVGLRKSQISISERLSRRYLNAGDFEKAISAYRTCYRQYPKDTALQEKFIHTLESIKLQADEASSKEDFASAGKAYQALLKNYKDFKQFEKSLSFSEKQLDDGLKNCTLQLKREGLAQYRRGELAEAISTWKSILIFDPDNAEIKKAIETATTQLKKIKKEGKESQ